MHMRNLLYAATAVGALAVAAPASADTIITFGQTSGSNTITGTGGLTGTTFGGTDIGVSISQIDANPPLATPIVAFLDLSATNTSGATVAAGLVGQHFDGTFSITSGAGDTGTNYLSGSFSDGALTEIGSTGIAVFANTGSFTSDVITTLSLPRSISFGLTNVTPAVSLVTCTVSASCDTGETLASFGASVAGNASAAAPEPASLAILGVGLLGLGVVANRKRS
jgi:PEP-CTERM motif